MEDYCDRKKIEAAIFCFEHPLDLPEQIERGERFGVLFLDVLMPSENGIDTAADKVCYQLFYKLDENLSERMAQAIGWKYELSEADYADPAGTVRTWLESEEAYASPFFDQEYVDGYFTAANELLARSQEVPESGKTSNQS